MHNVKNILYSMKAIDCLELKFLEKLEECSAIGNYVFQYCYLYRYIIFIYIYIILYKIMLIKWWASCLRTWAWSKFFPLPPYWNILLASFSYQITGLTVRKSQQVPRRVLSLLSAQTPHPHNINSIRCLDMPRWCKEFRYSWTIRRCNSAFPRCPLITAGLPCFDLCSF